MANVGGIVENPEMYKYLSGLENLRQYARMREGVTEERIKEVVELVRLSNRINDKGVKILSGYASASWRCAGYPPQTKASYT